MLDEQNVAALRMRRQFIGEKASEEEYETLFRDLSPVHTVYWCCPGEPPVLSYRASFDDRFFNTRRRARREILKGRFQGGQSDMWIGGICPSTAASTARPQRSSPKSRRSSFCC